jgi:hypothetical protein
MALTHGRNIEVFAFLAPLVLAKPFAEQLGMTKPVAFRVEETSPSFSIIAVAALAIATAGWAVTKSHLAYHHYRFLEAQTPIAAVDVLERRPALRIFSTAPFGGYLISRNIKTFIDGRAELYGEKFVLDYFDAVEAKNVDTLLQLLDTYRIDATLLNATSPAAQVLDHIGGWKRLYTDDIAVIHVREERPKTELSSAAHAPN